MPGSHACPLSSKIPLPQQAGARVSSAGNPLLLSIFPAVILSEVPHAHLTSSPGFIISTTLFSHHSHVSAGHPKRMFRRVSQTIFPTLQLLLIRLGGSHLPPSSRQLLPCSAAHTGPLVCPNTNTQTQIHTHLPPPTHNQHVPATGPLHRLLPVCPPLLPVFIRLPFISSRYWFKLL